MSTPKIDQRERLRSQAQYHSCDLPSQSKQTGQIPSPYGHYCDKLFYRLRYVFTIAESIESWQHFRSNASFNRERNRHLGSVRYQFIIHPLSNFTRRRHYVMTFVWLIIFIEYPFNKAFNFHYFTRHLSVLDTIADFMFLLDVGLRFFSGYIIGQTREIVLEHRRIVIHYLKTFFFVDVFPLVLSCVRHTTHPEKSFVYDFYFLSCGKLVRFIRIVTVISGFDRLLQNLGVKDSFRSVLSIYLSAVICIHWWTCTLKVVNVIKTEYKIPYNNSWLYNLQQEAYFKNYSAYLTHILEGRQPSSFSDIIDEYAHYVTVITCHFFGAGHGLFRVQEKIEMFILSLVGIFGMIFYLYTIAFLLHNFSLSNISEIKYEEVMEQIKDFMIAKRYPPNIKQRVRQYYVYKFDGRFFSEKKILDSLTNHIQMEVLLYSCRNLLEKVPMFRGLSKAAAGCILALLKQEIFLPEDQIMRADDDSGTLYFILCGTCAVTLMNGKEAMHIEDGNHFGQNNELLEDTRDNFVMYQVVAVEPCEIYTLSKENMEYCCKKFPEVRVKLITMYAARSRYYNNVLARFHSFESISATDIVAELRRRRIIEQARHRLGRLVSSDDV